MRLADVDLTDLDRFAAGFPHDLFVLHRRVAPVWWHRATAHTPDGVRSRITAILEEGAGVVTTRGDTHYVVTEYGAAFLHGKTMRERAMALINIAHPDFRAELLHAAKRRRLVYPNQIMPPVRQEYPDHLEKTYALRNGQDVLLRPIKPDDESLMKEFFYSLSDKSFYQRFFTHQLAMPSSTLQHMVNPDYDEEMGIIGLIKKDDRELMVALGRYFLDRTSNMAEIAFIVRDSYQMLGIGSFLLRYLIDIAKSRGIRGFRGEVLKENKIMMHVLHQCGYPMQSRLVDDCYTFSIIFKE